MNLLTLYLITIAIKLHILSYFWVSVNNNCRGMSANRKNQKNKPVKDFGNNPFFVKKAQEMKELIQKVGLPKDFKKQARVS